MGKSELQQIGEHDLAKAVASIRNIWQVIVIVLAKYGMIGIVLGYFGWQNFRQTDQIVALVQRVAEVTNANALHMERLSAQVSLNVNETQTMKLEQKMQNEVLAKLTAVLSELQRKTQ